MICEILKKPVDCALMTPRGCGYNGGRCHPVVEACEGCAHIFTAPEGRFCARMPNPSVAWMLGRCAFATHAKAEPKEAAGNGKKVNPLKASKRKAGR